MGHFKTNTLQSVVGDPLVKLARGKDHFLFRLNQVIDWQEFTPKLVEAYKGKACRGESPYHPLTLFKRRLQKHDGIGDFKVIFDSIIRQALEKGVRFGSIQIVDAVHTVANVNTDKDRERHEEGKRLVTKANGAWSNGS